MARLSRPFGQTEDLEKNTMEDFKDLALDGDKIAAAVQAFAAGRTVTGPKKTAQFDEYEVASAAEGGHPTKIQVFAKKSSKFTLHWQVGKNPEESKQLAEHILGATEMAPKDPKPLGLKKIEKAEWDVLLELLAESKLTLAEEAIPHGVRYKVSASAHDFVYVHRYNTGSFLMQGKQYSAYGTVVNILSSFADAQKTVIEAQLETLDIKNVSSDGLLKELDERAPETYKAIDQTSRCVLAPALAFLKLDIKLPDYSSFTHAALRGLECGAKHLLSQNGIVAAQAEGLGTWFDKNTFTLRAQFLPNIACKQTIGALQEFFKLYATQRHSLFHADGSPVLTRIVEDRAEAISIIDDVLVTLEKGFSCIATGSGYA